MLSRLTFTAIITSPTRKTQAAIYKFKERDNMTCKVSLKAERSSHFHLAAQYELLLSKIGAYIINYYCPAVKVFNHSNNLTGIFVDLLIIHNSLTIVLFFLLSFLFTAS